MGASLYCSRVPMRAESFSLLCPSLIPLLHLFFSCCQGTEKIAILETLEPNDVNQAESVKRQVGDLRLRLMEDQKVCSIF